MQLNKALADHDTPELVVVLAELLQKKRWMLATAESCTGGLIGAACTDLAGSSAWFERGFITYSNEAKTELLGVDAGVIAAHGAVSEPVARAMATGAIAHSPPSRVACTSWMWTPFSAGWKPSSSVLPKVMPPLMPPPAIQMVNACGW